MEAYTVNQTENRISAGERLRERGINCYSDLRKMVEMKRTLRQKGIEINFDITMNQIKSIYNVIGKK